MDYILQVEKLISYLKLNFDFTSSYKIEIFKNKFNQDLNLIGCFIKDFLILKTNNYEIADNDIYNSFVLYFDENLDSKEKILQELNEYGDYYLMIAFEEIENIELLNEITTINSCFNLECYPLIMKILKKYFNSLIDNKTTLKMLQSLVNIVLFNFDNNDNKINISDIYLGEDDIYLNDKLERIAI